MAEPRKPRRRPQDAEAPQPFAPRPPRPPSPHELEDLQLAPGDPFVRAAYDRVAKTTAQLGGSLGGAVADASGNDALMLRKLSKRSRVLTFQVMGIVWKAGFAKELHQTPAGAGLKLQALPAQELREAGHVLRPVEPELEAVLRELIPAALLEAADKMYGLMRVLTGLSLYLVPRDDGAVAGIVATFGDSPTSRRHALYLQTHLRRADPAVLDQILATFRQALPKTELSKQGPDRKDFWQELERSLYQVKATYRTSALHENSEKVKSQLTTSLKLTGDGVEKALGAVGKAGDRLEWLAYLPIRGLMALMQGFTNAVVGLIQLLDRMLGKR